MVVGLDGVNRFREFHPLLAIIEEGPGSSYFNCRAGVDLSPRQLHRFLHVLEHANARPPSFRSPLLREHQGGEELVRDLLNLEPLRLSRLPPLDVRCNPRFHLPVDRRREVDEVVEGSIKFLMVLRARREALACVLRRRHRPEERFHEAHVDGAEEDRVQHEP